MFKVKLIKAEMTYDLRHKVLRPFLTIEDCKYETDFEENTFHVGGFYKGQLVSIVSFVTDIHPDFSYKNQYRLRAMATLDDYRKLGGGRAVVEFGEEILRERGTEFLWCKGRTSVQEYYRRLGFTPYGEIFDYPPTGLHIVMYKIL